MCPTNGLAGTRRTIRTLTFRQGNFYVLFMAGVHDALVEQTAALSRFTAYATGPASVPFTAPLHAPFHSLASKVEIGRQKPPV